VSAESHDDIRAAAALLAIAASGSRARPLLAAVLDADPDPDRLAGIACVLAGLLADVLAHTGNDPREFARQIIAHSIGTEAAESTP
jgi:hypothetical protein